MAKGKAVSVVKKTQSNGRKAKGRRHHKSNTRLSPSPTDWLSTIGQSPDTVQPISNGVAIGTNDNHVDASSSAEPFSTPDSLLPSTDSLLDSCNTNGHTDVTSPSSGMRPTSFYGQKLQTHASAFRKSPQENLKRKRDIMDTNKEKVNKSAKRKLKCNNDSQKSKRTKSHMKTLKNLSIPLCDIVRSSPSPRSSPVFMVRDGKISPVLNGVGFKSKETTKLSGKDDNQMTNNGKTDHDIFEDKCHSETPEVDVRRSKARQSPMSIIDEVMFDLGSVCSEGSITSGFGSVNSGIFLKRDNGEYVFSSNSTTPDLSNGNSNVCVSPIDPDATLQKSQNSSIDSQEGIKMFGSFLNNQSDDSDRSYSPSQSASVTPAERSPERQTSITNFFCSSNKLLGSPKQSRRSIDNVTVNRKLERAGRKSNGRAMEQMHLDLGQRDFGHVTCRACGMVYTCAQPDDEAAHIRHHKKFVSGLKFNGWKNEKILQEFHDGRIIIITPDDHPSRLKKVEEIRKVVDMELGFADMPLRKGDSKTFLFIANKKVVGCCVATHIDKGYPVLPTPSKDSTPEKQIAAWCCSTTPVPAQCGISRIWVWSQCRRKKIATRLIDCVRNCFIYGCSIAKESLAFSDPTPDGKRLATSYIGTPEFLVFR